MSELTAERQSASFNVRELTYALGEGRQNVEKHETWEKKISSNPVFKKDLNPDRVTLFKRGMEKAKVLMKLSQEQNLSIDDYWAFRRHVGQELPTDLSLGMCLMTVNGQGTEEQRAYWVPLLENLRIIGCYAQTELGHGSNVRSLETVAVYDKATQEWVVSTPKVTSWKFWPGGLGRAATHALVFARLITPDKVDHGIAPFMVPIRSLETHLPLPGVTVGDIGPKMAYNAQDNGFLCLDSVRIPRENLLMKWVKVSPEGVYSKPPHEKISYATMIGIRSLIVVDSATYLEKAITIAIRYSCVRRQFGDGPQETKVLDYRMQQYRLFPILATAYAFHFTAAFMQNFYRTASKEISSGAFGPLAELHATSAGLKSFTTWATADGIETCRKCCGGHGYLLASALPQLFGNFVPSCTYEGDNAVLLQQTARWLLKAAQHAASGKKVGGTANYLQEFAQSSTGPRKCAATCPNCFSSLPILLAAFRHRAGRLVTAAGQRLMAEMGKGSGAATAWSASMIDLTRMTRAHCYTTVLRCFVESLEKLPSDSRAVLEKVCALFAVHIIITEAADWLEDGYMTGEQIGWARAQLETLLDQVRPEAVALVDAFNYSDFSLDSALGRADGDVYNALVKSAKESSLNLSEPVEGYKEHLRPLIKGEYLPQRSNSRL